MTYERRLDDNASPNIKDAMRACGNRRTALAMDRQRLRPEIAPRIDQNMHTAATMRALTFLCLALPVATHAAPYASSLSGDQFVQMMTHSEQLNPVQYMDREKAYSYLDGAKDATAGVTWCPSRPRKTFELAYDAADHLKTLTPEARKGNAATLLLVYLSSQYPCKRGKP